MLNLERTLTPSSGLARDLNRFIDKGCKIRVGIVGAGEMGTDLVVAISQIKGMQVTVIADRKLSGAPYAIKTAGYDQHKGVICETSNQVSKAVECQKIAIVQDSDLLTSHHTVDVVIDATGRPEAGAEVGMKAIENKKHLVMMNVEADVTVGAYLRHCADMAGVVYTIGAGDEPSATMELINFISAMGYPIVAAGKGKNNPLNIDAVPEDYLIEANARGMNPRMLVEFIDGSKTMVEMCCIANATGLAIDCPGMHGPDCELNDLHKVFCPIEDGGILSRMGCVDYSIGTNVAPGVFVITKMTHPRIRERMKDLALGDGPYYTFYRPYHLTSLEVPLSAARAVLYGTSDMQPLKRPVAEVCAKAKRTIMPGEVLDAIGETCYRSWAMQADQARCERIIPVGLLNGAKAIKKIEKGALIHFDDVFIKPNNKLYQLRRKQDAFLGYHLSL